MLSRRSDSLLGSSSKSLPQLQVRRRRETKILDVTKFSIPSHRPLLALKATSAPRGSTVYFQSSKYHEDSDYRVKKACINCKLSKTRCDNRRPCKRCKRTGRADSCRDSVHKKRGRSITTSQKFRLAPTVTHRSESLLHAGNRSSSSNNSNSIKRRNTPTNLVTLDLPGISLNPEQNQPQPATPASKQRRQNIREPSQMTGKDSKPKVRFPGFRISSESNESKYRNEDRGIAYQDAGRNNESPLRPFLDCPSVERIQQHREMDPVFSLRSSKNQPSQVLLNEQLGLGRSLFSDVKPKEVYSGSHLNPEGLLLAPTPAFPKLSHIQPASKPLWQGSSPRLEPFINPNVPTAPATMDFLPADDQSQNSVRQRGSMQNRKGLMLPPIRESVRTSLTQYSHYSAKKESSKPKKVTYLELVLTISNEELEKWNRMIGESRKRLDPMPPRESSNDGSSAASVDSEMSSGIIFGGGGGLKRRNLLYPARASKRAYEWIAQCMLRCMKKLIRPRTAETVDWRNVSNSTPRSGSDSGEEKAGEDSGSRQESPRNTTDRATVMQISDRSLELDPKDVFYGNLPIGVAIFELYPAPFRRKPWVNQQLADMLGWSNRSALSRLFSSINGISLVYHRSNLQVSIKLMMEAFRHRREIYNTHATLE
mmetsp:Transcript_12072/g.29693  ORF Transcript_12072/g.29693 Transcript_12072/m.29693 type:complete len:652 (+) Transcript_12072:79-2034(+)